MTDRPLLSDADRAFLERARLLARQGWGRVHPNPLVGCVLVRAGEVVAEGYHETFGGPHAEIVALERARSSAEGTTAYVSLEPCDHHGKTPPCSHALVEAGIRRVVYGAADPGEASGGGAETLRAAGVEVVGPAWEPEVARAENPAFQHVARHGTPFVALKLAMTLDAKLARLGSSTRITGPEAEHEVHRLRTGHDAVLIGAGTAHTDDPRLTVRQVAPGHRPLHRIVLAPNADLSPDAALFHDVASSPVHVFTRLDASEVAIEHLEAAGARVHPVANSDDALHLDAVLDTVWELGIESVMCEGGAELTASLLREGLVQRLYIFVAPWTLGDGSVPAFPADRDLEWDAFRPIGAPATFGRDSLIVLDRQEG